MFVASRNAKPLKLLEDLHLNEHKDGTDRGAQNISGTFYYYVR